MRAPPPEPLTMISGNFRRVASSVAQRQLLADDGPHAARHEGEVGDGEHDRPPTNVASSHHGRVGHACLGLLRLDAVAVEDAIVKLQGIAWP